MKGIVLAGGTGSRLYPLTKSVSKQLLPVYKQPMIYYPLKTLKKMGIEDVLIIVASGLQRELFEKQLGGGKKFDINIHYVVQEKPNGIAEAFILGEKFIGSDDVVLILGDNVVFETKKIECEPNMIFTYKVKNPSAYGVAIYDGGKLKHIEEKPKEFIGEDAVIGLYCFSNDVVDVAKQLKPSERGELEIVDVIRKMDEKYSVKVEELEGVWFDCGTYDDLLDCSNFVKALDNRTTQDILLEPRTPVDEIAKSRKWKSLPKHVIRAEMNGRILQVR